MAATFHVLLALLRTAFSAVAYRVRGGGFLKLPGTQAARLVWGLAMFGTASTAAHAPLWVCAVTGLLAALSMIDCGGHGEHQDLGRMWPGYTKDGKTYELLTWPFRRLFERAWSWPFWRREILDAAAMSWIGVCRGVATVPLVAFYDSTFATCIVAGYALQGPAYWLGWRVPWTLPGLAARSTEWGELFTGAAVALPLVLL